LCCREIWGTGDRLGGENLYLPASHTIAVASAQA
jgi:hypothetical protein